MLHEVARRLRALSRLEQFALWLWALALLMVSLRAAVLPHNSVYTIFSGAGRDWLAGRDLYRPVLELYRYSPPVTVLFIPFGLLPDSLGGVLWRVLNAAAYLVAVVWWCSAALPQPLSRNQQAWLLLLLLPLSIGNLNNGQSNTVVMASLLLGVAALASRAGRVSRGWHGTIAAGCVALACLFKVYPIALGLLLVLVRPRRFTGRLLLWLAFGLAMPFLFQRPGYVATQYLGWIHHLESSDRHEMPRELWYRDFHLLCTVCQVPLSTMAYRVVQLVAAGACAAGCVAARRAGWAERRLVALATVLGCVWMTVFGAATESSTYILVAPLAAWACLLASAGPRSLVERGCLATGYGLLTLAQVANVFPWGKVLHMYGIQPFGTLILLVGLLAVLFRERTAAVAAPPQPLAA
jgi:hypothetical protein